MDRLDDIDKKDAIDRTELNRRLGVRFDREVNNRTRSINHMVWVNKDSLIKIAATNEEIDVMNGMKSTSTFDKVISFLFSSIIEGLSWIGLIPLCRLCDSFS